MNAAAKYVLECALCRRQYPGDPFRLKCDEQHGPALLRTVYRKRRIDVRDDLPGVFRYSDWLPGTRVFEEPARPITYQSTGLAGKLGLENLFVSFNGYWPERGAVAHSCSFKQLEALSVLSNLPESVDGTMVVASAGNTGRAFAQMCALHHVPLYVVIPEQNLSAIWSTRPFNGCVRLVAAGGNSDYCDAIELAQHLCSLPGFFPEGGAANAARRDGLSLPVLDAAVTLGRIPDHYFQAVGSGTGAIAAWEVSERLLADGRFGGDMLRLHLGQNKPFTPMSDAWKVHSRETTLVAAEEAREAISRVFAKVLSNRRPAYAVQGGLYDALVATKGEMYSIGNEDAQRMSAEFERLEGIDINPAAAVAVMSLVQAVESGAIDRRDSILLNITGGGEGRLRRDFTCQQLATNLVIGTGEIKPAVIAQRMMHLMPAFS